MQSIPSKRAHHVTFTSLSLLFLLLLIGGCTSITKQEPGIGKKVTWEELPGWGRDNLFEAWPALLSQCDTLSKKQPNWNSVCTHANQLTITTDSQIRAFLQQHFQPHEVIGTDGTPNGLITGYYEPLLFGSLTPDERFKYPLYARPDSLLTIDLASQYPELKGKRVRGRLVGNRVIPFHDRAEIDGQSAPLKGNELLWVDDPYASFFLQIQGSGVVQLPDGSIVKAGYADQNGHSYVSIGKKLIEWGELKREEVSLFSLKRWLKENPDRANQLLNENPSYVFFTLSENNNEGPRGSLNVPLTAERSAAVDRSVIPLGTPIWLNSTLPVENVTATEQSYNRLLFAQDTGGAIKGAVRADVFFGQGDRAEKLAGTMKQPGKLYALLLKAD